MNTPNVESANLHSYNSNYKDYTMAHYTLNSCAETALKYNTRTEFRKNAISAYNFAWKHKILDSICTHMIVKQSKWTNKMLENLALKYTTKKEFNHNNKSAYITALNRGIIDSICAHMSSGRFTWTIELCMLESKKYKTKGDFALKSQSAYQSARKNNWLESICSHMKSPIIMWTIELCRIEANKYITTGDFQKGSRKAYQSAQSNGWKKEICKHMQPGIKGAARINYIGKPTTLYHIKITSINSIALSTPVYKIGITKKSLIERFIYDNIKYDIIQTTSFENGAEAWDLEQLILIQTSDFKYTNILFDNFAGRTELRKNLCILL